MEPGTAIAELLLVRLTLNPPLGAAAFSVTVQTSVPAPVIDPLAQVSPLNTGALATAGLTAVSLQCKSFHYTVGACVYKRRLR